MRRLPFKYGLHLGDSCLRENSVLAVLLRDNVSFAVSFQYAAVDLRSVNRGKEPYLDLGSLHCLEVLRTGEHALDAGGGNLKLVGILYRVILVDDGVYRAVEALAVVDRYAFVGIDRYAEHIVRAFLHIFNIPELQSEFVCSRSDKLTDMKRNGFSKETIRAVKDLYDIFFRHGLSMSNAIAKAEAEVPQLPEVIEFLDFVKSTKRGILTGDRGGRRA